MRALWTFAGTAAALVFAVGLALQSGQAQTGTVEDPGTEEAHFPILGLTKDDAAKAHVINLSTDLTRSALRFAIVFLDSQGFALKQWDCEVRAGESCSATLTPDMCPEGVDRPARCEFRTLVVVGRTTDAGGLWSANVEVVDSKGATIVNAGPIQVLKVPRTQPPPGTDDGGTDVPGSDVGTDVPGSDVGTDFPGSDFPGIDDPGTDFGGTDGSGGTDAG